MQRVLFANCSSRCAFLTIVSSEYLFYLSRYYNTRAGYVVEWWRGRALRHKCIRLPGEVTQHFKFGLGSVVQFMSDEKGQQQDPSKVMNSCLSLPFYRKLLKCLRQKCRLRSFDPRERLPDR